MRIECREMEKREVKKFDIEIRSLVKYFSYSHLYLKGDK